MARLGDVGRVLTGNTPKTSEIENYATNDICFIKPSDISNDCITEINTSEYYISEVARKKVKILPVGSILVTCIGIIGKIAITNIECAFNQQINAIIPHQNKCLDKYLAYSLQAQKRQMQDLSNAPVVPILNKTQFSDIEIALPPLEEQQRVAITLDKVCNLISLRKQQLDRLDNLVKSQFIEMFGDFVYDKSRWSVCEVGDVADIIDPQPSHRTPPVSVEGIPYVGIADCDYGQRTIDFMNARKVGWNVLAEHKKRYTLSDGDFIIGKIGTIGKPFFISTDQNYTLSANTVLIKPTHGKIVPQYLFSVFQSEYMDGLIDSEKKSTSQPAFGIQKVRRILVPLPPLELQQQFADFVEQVDKSKFEIQQSLDKLNILYKALMQQYFG